MGEPDLIINFKSEADLVDIFGDIARRLVAARSYPLIVGLRGDLGSGKTTCVRAMLRGLGLGSRIPSPTYTLLEHYRIGELVAVHLDLYRLAGEEELENLGLRDWLEQPHTWILVEWPDRAPSLAARCDLLVTFEEPAVGQRRVTVRSQTSAGDEALRQGRHACVNKAG
jgi:tRNA threonylcarbamoyladenosine biosynthesis protein TsaE